MKLKRIAVFVFVLFTTRFTLIANPDCAITLHVVDDQGHSLTNFPIGMGVISGWKPGEGFGTDLTESWTNITDANGMTTATHKCYNPEIGVWAQGVNGYYPSRITYNYTNAVAGKWQPWNPSVEFVVKPILNPIPMYAQAVRTTIPAKNKAIGYDLEVGDWVAPYGKGSVGDFIFSLNEKVPFTRISQPYDVINSLSFSNKGDGIQSLMLTGDVGSAFLLPRLAPGSGYQPTLAQQLYSINNKISDGAVSNDQNYFYRVRTVIDEKGNVKSALYGKIAGPIECGAQGYIQFTYYLNPNPNDRNMEFDPNKNLFQNLSIIQQVKAP